MKAEHYTYLDPNCGLHARQRTEELYVKGRSAILNAIIAQLVDIRMFVQFLEQHERTEAKEVK